MNPFRSIRQAPVTVCLIWVACTLLVGVYIDTTHEPGSRQKVMREWGAGLPLIMISADTPDSEFEEIAGSVGPMQVWDGEWWRLLVNNLHHVGLIHLMLNGCAMIYLGRVIERRMSFFLYLLFLAGSAFMVAAVSGLLGEWGVGLSGIGFAQVGLLMVWRDRDESIADEFTIRMVLLAGMWLILCQVITYADILHIGNVAHYTGLVYGWIWGQVYLEQQQKGIFRFLFSVSHFLLYPAFWFILHPFWLGSWHWYQSQELDLAHDELQRTLEHTTGDKRPRLEREITRIEAELNSESWQRRKTERLQTALLLEPSIEMGWLDLSEMYAKTGDRRLSLRTALEGLKYNRGSAKLLHRCVDLWVDDEQRTEDSNVPKIVEQVFGAESEIWKEKLTVRVETEQNRRAWQVDELAQLLGTPQFQPRFPLGIPRALLSNRQIRSLENLRDYLDSGFSGESPRLAPPHEDDPDGPL